MRRRRRTHLPLPRRATAAPEIEVIMLGPDLAVLRRNNITVPGGYITRAQLPTRLSDLVSGEGRATSVVIIEPDGTRHTDLLSPPARATAERPTTVAPGAPALHGGGFLPGEEVQLHRLVTATRADPDGHASAASAPDEVTLLYGVISGTVICDPGRV